MTRRQPAITYWIGSRPVHGPAKKAQVKAPSTGRIVGVRKCLWLTLSFLRISTATLTIAKTQSSNSAVVPPSSFTPPANRISATASSDVKMIAMYGVRRAE
ncbi:hypothetical protein D3C87_1904820 [compost metagenome]